MVCRRAVKQCWKSAPGIESGNLYGNSSGVEYFLHITALINRRTQSADVSFEMLDNRDGKPIDVDKIKEPYFIEK